MSRRVGNTVVPRNPVARATASRRGGVHERGRTAERMRVRQRVRFEIEYWREELAFERDLISEDESLL